MLASYPPPFYNDKINIYIHTYGEAGSPTPNRQKRTSVKLDLVDRPEDVPTLAGYNWLRLLLLTQAKVVVVPRRTALAVRQQLASVEDHLRGGACVRSFNVHGMSASSTRPDFRERDGERQVIPLQPLQNDYCFYCCYFYHMHYSYCHHHQCSTVRGSLMDLHRYTLEQVLASSKIHSRGMPMYCNNIVTASRTR